MCGLIRRGNPRRRGNSLPRVSAGARPSCIADTSLVAADDALIQAQEKAGDTEALATAMATLNPRERYVLEQRELADEPKTLQELSDELGMQVQQRAREKITQKITGTKKPSVLSKKKPSKEGRAPTPVRA